jgi:hypothetical protein
MDKRAVPVAEISLERGEIIIIFIFIQDTHINEVFFSGVLQRDLAYWDGNFSI